MSEKDKKTCGIILDIENLLCASMEDAHIPDGVSMAHRADLIGALVLEDAALIGEIVGAAAAIAPLKMDSSASPEEKQKREKQRKVWTKIQHGLFDRGYDILCVQQSANSADHALRKQAEQMIADDQLTAMIVATGDGRDPFPRLVETLRAKGVAVHVVTYDTLPFFLHQKREGVTHTYLAPSVRIACDADDVAAHPQKKAEGLFQKSPRVSRAQYYQMAAKSIREKSGERYEPYHSRLIKIAKHLGSLSRETDGGSPHHSFFGLKRISEKNMAQKVIEFFKHHPDKDDPETPLFDEGLDIVRVLCRMNVFREDRVISWVPESDFLKLAEHDWAVHHPVIQCTPL